MTRVLSNRYEIIDSVGDGAFGVVTKCLDRTTGELVAVKRMKERYQSWEECLELKEVKSLRKICKQHCENIVELKTVFREDQQLYLVFELCDRSLLKVMKDNSRGLPEPFIRSTIKQLLEGLKVVHQSGFFHRDIKPENLLFAGDVLKVLDFGLAREIRSRPPYTQYAGTRWYRAPEILLRLPCYNSPADIWAVGVITAEMFTLKPLFQGSSEVDQIYKIVSVLGPPSSSTWPEGAKLAQKMGLRFANSVASGLSAMIANASPEALEFIQALTSMNPNRRPSAVRALQMPFLQGEKMKLSELDKAPVKRVPPLTIEAIAPQARPHAAVSPMVAQIRPSGSISHDGLVSLMRDFGSTQPVDYSQFDLPTSDDLFDEL